VRALFVAVDGRGLAHDRRTAWTAGALLFVFLGAHTVLEVARDALFLTHLAADELPLTYLGLAGLVTVASQLDARLSRRLDDRWALATTFGAGAVGALVFRGLFGLDARWVPHGFYLWTGCIASLAVAQFWRLGAGLFTVASAKRFFGPVGAGGALGALAGAGLAAFAQRSMPPRDLLVLGAILLAGAALVPVLALPVPAPRPAPPLLRRDPVARADTRRHLRLLFGAVALTALCATLVDYAFKSSIDRALPTEELGPFFGRFYLGMNLLSLAIQVLIAPLVLRVFGVTRVLWTHPITLLLGALGAALAGGLAAVILLRGVDGALRQSLHRSALELLQFPLSEAQRRRHKAFVDGLGQRAGQALGSLAILGASLAGLGPSAVVLAIAVLALPSAALALALGRSYVELFRHRLRAGALDTSAVGPALDLASLEALIVSLHSDRDEELLSALDLLVAHGRGHLVPTVLVHHQSARVALRVLDLLAEAGRADLPRNASRLERHPDPEIRAAAARIVARTLSASELERRRRREPRGAVHDALLVAIVARSLDHDGSARRAIDERARVGTAEERLALVRAIRVDRASSLLPVLHALAPRADGSLRRELARAFGALGDASSLPMLVRWVGPRAARAEARAALAALGSVGLDAAARALGDTRLPRRLRAELPGSIALFGAPEAAAVLFDALDTEQDGWIRYKCLRALRRLRETLPEHALDRRRLLAGARRSLDRACALLSQRIVLRTERRGAVGVELLEPLLLEKEQQALDRAVQMIALSHPLDLVNGLVLGVRSVDRRVRAESLELLAHLVDPPLGRAFAAFLDERAEDDVRLSRTRTALGTAAAPRAPRHEQVVGELLRDPSDAVRVIAAAYAAEVGLSALAEPLRHALLTTHGGAREVIEHALSVVAPSRQTRHA
jgi:AAA family ATP:ADP antiporter